MHNSNNINAMTTGELNTMWQQTMATISLLGSWLNSAALWELMGAFIGLLVVCSLIAMIIRGIFASIGFRARDY